MSKNAVSKVNADDDAALIYNPMLPDDLGKTTDAEVGVILNPVPSASRLDERVQYKVVEPIVGLICARHSYPVKSNGVEGVPVLYSNRRSKVFPCLIINE